MHQRTHCKQCYWRLNIEYWRLVGYADIIFKSFIISIFPSFLLLGQWPSVPSLLPSPLCLHLLRRQQTLSQWPSVQYLNLSWANQLANLENIEYYLQCRHYLPSVDDLWFRTKRLKSMQVFLIISSLNLWLSNEIRNAVWAKRVHWVIEIMSLSHPSPVGKG